MFGTVTPRITGVKSLERIVGNFLQVRQHRQHGVIADQERGSRRARALATASVPMTPAAPARFSTTIVVGLPASLSFCWNIRASMSPMPAGAVGTMNLMGFDG